MSPVGTLETCRKVRFTAALGGKADLDQVVLRYVPFQPAWYPPRAGAQTFAASGSACRGGWRMRKNYRPSFMKDRGRARFRQGRCAPPLAVAFGKP